MSDIEYSVITSDVIKSFDYLKYFTFSMLLINLKWTIFSCVIHKCILFNIQSNCLLRIHKHCYPSVAFLKPVSILSQAMKICYSKVVYCLHVHVTLPLAFSFLSKCTIYFEHAHL